MADSPAVRQRRHRQHLAGDHTLCKRCDQAAAADESSHELESLTENYLVGEVNATMVLSEVLMSAARSVDVSPGPGAIRAFREALGAYEHAKRTGYVT